MVYFLRNKIWTWNQFETCCGTYRERTLCKGTFRRRHEASDEVVVSLFLYLSVELTATSMMRWCLLTRDRTRIGEPVQTDFGRRSTWTQRGILQYNISKDFYLSKSNRLWLCYMLRLVCFGIKHGQTRNYIHRRFLPLWGPPFLDGWPWRTLCPSAAAFARKTRCMYVFSSSPCINVSVAG